MAARARVITTTQKRTKKRKSYYAGDHMVVTLCYAFFVTRCVLDVTKFGADKVLFFLFEITLLKFMNSWWKRYWTRGRSSDAPFQITE